MSFLKKRILLTGATGFIGSALAHRLSSLNCKQLFISKRSASDTWRIKALSEKAKVIDLRIEDEAAVRKSFSMIRPEIVIHTAVYGGFGDQKEDEKIIQANLRGTLNLLEASARTGVKLFINTGSSSEYGMKRLPMKEDAVCLPENLYGITKLSSTLLTKNYALRRGLSAVTLRIFSPYGYYDDSRRLIPEAILSILRNRAMELSDSGIVRDYIFIDDVVSAYLKALEKESFNGEIINIGSGRQHTIGSILRLLEKITGKKGKFRWNSRKRNPFEPKLWQADIKLAGKLLCWKPEYTVEEGLALTARWFKKNTGLYE